MRLWEGWWNNAVRKTGVRRALACEVYADSAAHAVETAVERCEAAKAAATVKALRMVSEKSKGRQR
ncbi:MAG: hypothetical protein KGL39_27895 [Patescibacteria group bacterium]|nr:hypothetical protein [Patescibacteria group bacterium]